MSFTYRALLRAVAAVAVAFLLASADNVLHSDDGTCAADNIDCALINEVSLLQTKLAWRAKSNMPAMTPSEPAGRDLVFVHVPFNFGHTVEHVAMFGSGALSTGSMLSYVNSLGGIAGLTRRATWAEANAHTQPGGTVWGHLNPDLQVMSDVTGCPMYYTPQKYWPVDLAKKYIGNMTVFGLLRDPYERLVALIRGNNQGYGAGLPRFHDTCDINGGVKQLLKDYISGGNKFANGCTLLPQAEFFDGPFGINLPIDNRYFPTSVNHMFKLHGYPYKISMVDIVHVADCQDTWAADLDEETRKMVRDVYSKDFDLLCEHFDYCDREEDCCIWQVPKMCPPKVLASGYKGRRLNATQ